MARKVTIKKTQNKIKKYTSLKLLLLIVILLSSAQVYSQKRPFEFSMGLGERYAGVGFSGELGVFENLGITAGLGALGGRAGIDYYFRNVPDKLKYRVSVGYGLVAEVDCVDCDEDEKYYSYTLGLGIKRNGFEYSVYYLDVSEYEDDNKILEAQGFETESINKFRFSLGYIF
jgi:hypothetical protein